MDKETRTCIGCGKKSHKNDFFRITYNNRENDSNKGINVDLFHNQNCRSYYLCKNKLCIKNSFKRKNIFELFSKKINILELDKDFIQHILLNKEYDKLEQNLYKNIVDNVGEISNKNKSLMPFVTKDFLYIYLKEKIKLKLLSLLEYSIEKYSVNNFSNLNNKDLEASYLIIFFEHNELEFKDNKILENIITQCKLKEIKTIKISNKLASTNNKICIIRDKKLANVIMENEFLIVNFDGLL